ncbi:TonB-dependent receptor [Iodidimonas nitroreducens]|uniref:TonB-dependent receptor n=2 Tax=Iodidimonas nitroreducens TaxID=1236968 RepID=A0A5A7NAA7_9PROT|nr:protein oar [alpha proteobacterium Q-1]GER03916.1 TonB-dependent receptor [Iodidimonas nitroreducens]
MLKPFLVGLFMAGVSAIPLAHAQVAMDISLRTAADNKPLSNIPVILENLETGQVITGTTDRRGLVRFNGLSTSGEWIARTEPTKAYRAARTEAISLRSGFDSSLSLMLMSASELEEISVTASRSYGRLNRSNAEISASFSADEIERLPVEGRSLERVLFRLPNVTQATGFFNEAPSIAINGANSLFTNYMIDGLDNNENFLGGMRFPVPIGAIEDVTVLASNYSAEFGRTANGIVNVTTKSGGNEVEGELFFVSRPGGALSSNNGFNPRDLSGNLVSNDFQRYQAGFAVGGPIIEDRTFYFINMEYTRDDTNNLLNVPELGVAEQISGQNDFLLTTARIDHRWTDRLTSTLRLNHGRVTLERPGGGISGGTIFPSAGSEQTRRSTNAALTTTYRGDRFTYSGSVQYSRFDWNFTKPLADNENAQATLLDPSGRAIATIGHPGSVFDERENTVQFQQKLSFESGRHRFSFGSDVIISDFSLRGGGNPNGNFLLMLDETQLGALRNSNLGSDFSINDLPANLDVIQAVFETAPKAFGTSQETYSLFAEDQIMVTPDLSVTLGLRWEYDSLSKGASGSGDFDNIAPRIGANWSFRKDMALRAGVGLFYEKVPYTVVSDALQFSTDTPGFRGQLQSLIDQGLLPADADIDQMTNAGTRAIDAADLCNGFGDCPDPASVRDRQNALSSSELRILNPDGLDNPYAFQASLGWQWEMPGNYLLSIDGMWSEGHNLVRLRDVNAPAPFTFNQAAFDALGAEAVAALTPEQRQDLGLVRSSDAANATRPALLADGSIPAGGARSIIMSETDGRSRYRALTISMEKPRDADPYSFLIAYTLSRLTNNTDDVNFRANDSNDFAADFGPSLNDRTHALSTLFSVYPLDGLTLSIAGLFQSGQPINFVPDARVFGTTDLNGDGLSFADQFTGNPDRAPGFDRNSGRLSFASTVDLGAAYEIPLFSNRMELRMDIFNLFNANNDSGFPVNFTQSNQIQTAGQDFVQRSAAPARTVQLSARFLF